MRWLILSFAPSSLLLGVTTHISTDIAAVPLLWVIPLALYLSTFVLVFARRTVLPHAWMIRLQPYLVLLLAVLFFHRVSDRPVPMLLLHLATFFVIAMVCHGELARTRPKPDRLTEFYLYLSIGGVLGGLFNAIVVPELFPKPNEFLAGVIETRRGIFEYPLMIAVACLLRPKAPLSDDTALARRLDLALPLALLFGLGAVVFGMELAGLFVTASGTAIISAPAALIAFSFRKRPLRFGLGVGAILLAGAFCCAQMSHAVWTQRNFFGVLRVIYQPDSHAYSMVHGTTEHGAQRLDPAHRLEPLTYYHRTGPLGDIFEAMSGPRKPREIGIIGLGTGAIASYGQAGQHITYYEINPSVERIARDPQYFTYLESCKADIDVILGDARLALANAPDGHFNLLILDAFNSDAIPIHLITREAIQLYLDKLAEDGVLALHISNRCLNLAPVLGNIAKDRGVVCRLRWDGGISDQQRREGKSSSLWGVMARRPEHLEGPLNGPNWRPLPPDPDSPLWTDDFSSILSVLNWW